MAREGNARTPATDEQHSASAYQLGIDFGTSTTFVAFAVGQADPQLLNFGGSTALPTALYYEENGNFDFGESAVKKGHADPERLITRWKTLHEIGGGTVNVSGAVLRVEQLTHGFFWRILDRALLKLQRYPDVIVATHPSYWDEIAKDSFRRALDRLPARVNLRCASEAACWAYDGEVGRISRNDLLAVYDIGSSGVDVSWVKRTDRGFEAKAAVKASGPDGTGGFSGNELTDFLLEQVTDSFARVFAHQGMGVPEINSDQLRHSVNLAMAELGGSRDPVVRFPGRPDYQVPLSMAAVVQLVERRLDESLDGAQLSLERKLNDAPAPHHVVLLGGLMQLPTIRAQLNKRGPIFKRAETPPRELVAVGAAKFPSTPPTPDSTLNPPSDPPIMLENPPELRRWSPLLFAVGIVVVLVLSLVALELLDKQPLPLDDPLGRTPATPPAGTTTPTPRTCPSSNATSSPPSQILSANEMIVPMSDARASTVLFRVDVSGTCGILRRIETHAQGNVSNPALDRGRRHIIYLDEGNHALRTVGADGRDDRRLFNRPPRCGDVVRFSRDPTDDTRLAVICAPRTGGRKLFVMSTDGRIIRELKTSQAIIDDPNISTDGAYVAFWGSRDQAEDGGAILVMPMDGSKRLPRRITAGGGHGIDADPVWSKDGTIAFRRQHNGDYDIWTKPLRSAEVVLVQGSFNDDRPSWSPDGALLAFVSDRGYGGNTGELGICIVAKDGTGVRSLHFSAYRVLAPTWGNR